MAGAIRKGFRAYRKSGAKKILKDEKGGFWDDDPPFNRKKKREFDERYKKEREEILKGFKENEEKISSGQRRRKKEFEREEKRYREERKGWEDKRKSSEKLDSFKLKKARNKKLLEIKTKNDEFRRDIKNNKRITEKQRRALLKAIDDKESRRIRGILEQVEEGRTPQSLRAKKKKTMDSVREYERTSAPQRGP